MVLGQAGCFAAHVVSEPALTVAVTQSAALCAAAQTDGGSVVEEY